MASQTRLKSSFIYLANAVNDLRDNWRTFALVLSPLIFLGALCLLPDALTLQHQLAEKFAPGVHNVVAPLGYLPVLQAGPVLPWWTSLIAHLLLLILALAADLVVLCAIRRDRAGLKHQRLLSEVLAVYREAVLLAPSFYWIVFLQILAPLIALATLRVSFDTSDAALMAILYVTEIAVLVFGALAYLWLYFARYALVFDAHRSFHGLLFSRDLMRKRFFRVATRIVVFLAVWSGYNSWAAGAFIFVSVILGPVGALTGYLWFTIFLLGLVITAVTYLTTTFFAAAGVRLYQDVTASALVTAQETSAGVLNTRTEPLSVGG